MDNILGWLIVIIAGGITLILCLYMIFAMFVMIGYKIYRKFKYGMSLYD